MKGIRFILLQSIFSFLILLETVFAQIYTIEENWIEDFKQSYHYVHIKNDIPYVVIDDIRPVHRLQKLIINSMLSIPNADRSISINPSILSSQILPFYTNMIRNVPLFSVQGSYQALHDAIGYAKGDTIIMQPGFDLCEGVQLEIRVSSIYFHTSFLYSYILLECEPIDVNIISAFRKQNNPQALIAHRFKSWDSDRFNNPFTASVPSQILDIFAELEKQYIPSSFYNTVLGPMYRTSITPFRIINHEGIGKIYYCGILSKGEKGVDGILYLFDENGNVIHSIEYYAPNPKIHAGLNRIIGLTDIDRNGTHEIVVMWGDGYGGGIALFVPEFDEAGILKLIMKLKITSLWD